MGKRRLRLWTLTLAHQEGQRKFVGAETVADVART